ncbi:MAG: NitT/TauT family transport system substrate-binding protein [Actinomycetota bacterium]|jgi:NitT/TauT family transport system substrate-binding protein|nr:NitT/TauT family transport system substrate-binding protein [Actinomycetota bacterium]
MRRRLAAVAVVVGLVALAACGGSDDESTSAGGGAGLSKVSLGFSAWPGWFPWQVAEEAGIFTKHGLDVDLKYFESYLDSLTALATGNVDGNSQTLNDTISSVSGGSKQSIVLVNDNSTGNDQIIVAPGITKVEDLKGKTVAIEEGTVDHYLLLLGLQQAGMKPGDIDLKPLPTADAAAAFAAGQVDAVGAFAPFTDTAITREGSKVLFSSADYPGAIPDHLVMDTAFVKSRPGDVQKLIDAWYDTLAYIGTHADESVAIMAKRAGVTADAYRAYDAGTTIFTVADNIEAFSPGNDQKHLDFVARQIVDLLLATGLIDTAPDLTGLLDPTFVKAAGAAG